MRFSGNRAILEDLHESAILQNILLIFNSVDIIDSGLTEKQDENEPEESTKEEVIEFVESLALEDEVEGQGKHYHFPPLISL